MTLQLIGSAINPVTLNTSAAAGSVPNGSVSSGTGYLGSGVLGSYNGLGTSTNANGTYNPSNAADIYAMQQGAGSGVAGNISTAISAASLANKLGPQNTGVGEALGALGGGLQAYQGLQQGGVLGYGGATVGALRASSGIAGLTGNAGLSSTLGAAAGYIAAPLALYSAVKNWQSGNTASDAIQGAEAGAAIGSIIPGVGTLIGGVVGGAVGAISSAFGGGKVDPETTSMTAYAQQYSSSCATKQQELTSSLNPAQGFQVLAGIFDAKNNSPGHSTPQEQIWGRAGEGAFTSAVFGNINSAIQKNPSLKDASPQTLYNQVVVPYLSSFKGSYGGGNTNADPNSTYTLSCGTKFGGAMESAIVSLIGNWQSGNFTGSTPVGISGQTMGSSLPAYGS
jgi:hypothetical protein